MRINKYLSERGIASRRAVDKLIEEGRVTVNGKVCKLGCEVDERDNILVDGKAPPSSIKYEYYIMNKPKGYITSVSDEKGRKTVMDLMPKNISRLFPVGRLDYDSEGLLILTNDGDLTFRLTHPKNEIPKTYSVKIEGSITESNIQKLRSGVEIDGVMTKKCRIVVTEETRDFTKLSVTVSEGRNRQIRRMFEAIGKEVVFLKRIKIGDLTLRGLDRGSVRKLSMDEVNYLKNL